LLDPRVAQLMGTVRDLIRREAWPQVLEVFDQIVELAPGEAGGHYNRASVLHHLRRLEEARAALARALELQPVYPVARQLMDRVTSQLEASRQAKAQASTLEALEPKAEPVAPGAADTGPSLLPPAAETAPPPPSAPVDDASGEWTLLPSGPVSEIPRTPGDIPDQPAPTWVLTPAGAAADAPVPPPAPPTPAGDAQWDLSPVSEPPAKEAQWDLSPVSRPPVGEPAAGPSSAQVAEFIRQSLQAQASAVLYVAPHIPEKKLQGAVSAYAVLRPGEQVIALFDNTVMGSAKSGFVITDQRVVWKAEFSAQITSLNLSDLEMVSVTGGKLRLRSGGGEYSLELAIMSPNLAAAVGGVLQAVIGQLRTGVGVPTPIAGPAGPPFAGRVTPVAEPVRPGPTAGSGPAQMETVVEDPFQRYLLHNDLHPRVLKSMTGLLGQGVHAKVEAGRGSLRLVCDDGTWVSFSSGTPLQILNLDLSGLLVWKGLFKVGYDRQKAGCFGCILAPLYLALYPVTWGLLLLSRVAPVPKGRVTIFAFVEGEPIDLEKPKGIDRIWLVYKLRHALRERRARQQRAVHLLCLNPAKSEHFREIVERALETKVTVVDDELADSTIMFRGY